MLKSLDEIMHLNGEPQPVYLIPDKIYKTLMGHALPEEFLDLSFVTKPIESISHYKLRKLKQWLKNLPSSIRWKLFPYYVVPKDEYEEIGWDY